MRTYMEKGKEGCKKEKGGKRTGKCAKRAAVFLTALVMWAVLLAGCGAEGTRDHAAGSSEPEAAASEREEKNKEENKVENEENKEENEENKEEDGETLLAGVHHAEITVKEYGVIKLELDADTAPVTVTNFVKLAEQGFYDGLTFHRIIDGFMIQGGDPNGNGTGGSGTEIKGEFEANGVKNEISHVRGTVSMARAQDYDSASSQFFIVQSDSTYLDGQYAGFGTVTAGMEIVDRICEERPGAGSSGAVEADRQPVIESIKITD